MKIINNCNVNILEVLNNALYLMYLNENIIDRAKEMTTFVRINGLPCNDD